jgi:hypothetical protein
MKEVLKSLVADALPWLLIISLSIALFKSCESNRLSLAETENYKKSQKVLQDKIKKSEYQTAQYIDTVFFYQKEIKKLSIKTKKLDSKYIPKIEGVKHYNSSDIAKFYQDTYKLPKQVETVENGTVLSDTVARLNIKDVFEGSLAKAKLKITNEIIETKDSIIIYKDSALAQKDTTIATQKKALTNCEKALENKPKCKRNRGLFFIIGIALMGVVNY